MEALARLSDPKNIGKNLDFPLKDLDLALKMFGFCAKIVEFCIELLNLSALFESMNVLTEEECIARTTVNLEVFPS